VGRSIIEALGARTSAAAHRQRSLFPQDA
jgi:hypothetical protein